MSEQYCLFDQERAAEGVGPCGKAGTGSKRKDPSASLRCAQDDEDGGRLIAAPTGAGERVRRGYRGPAPGKRFMKIGLANGTSIIVETALSMLELSNELRGKAKVKLTLADGRGVEVKNLDVAWLENVYHAPV